MDGRIVGVLAATLALAGVVHQALGLFTSLPLLLIGGAIAAAVGAGVGVIADGERVDRTAAVVISHVAVCHSRLPSGCAVPLAQRSARLTRWAHDSAATADVPIGSAAKADRR